MRARDTSADAHRAHIDAYRAMGAARRARAAARMSEEAREISAAGIRKRHPDYSESEVAQALRLLIFGEQLYRAAWPDAPVLAP